MTNIAKDDDGKENRKGSTPKSTNTTINTAEDDMNEKRWKRPSVTKAFKRKNAMVLLFNITFCLYYFSRSFLHYEISFDGSSQEEIAIITCATRRVIQQEGETKKQQYNYHHNLVNYLMPSLMNTIETSSYLYKLYVAVDQDGFQALSNNRKELYRHWDGAVLPMKVHAFGDKDSEPPSRIQLINSIARVAFDEGADYIVHVEDNTEFTSKHWTTLGMQALHSLDFPKVGVVGPQETIEDDDYGMQSTDIMAAQMTHRKHLEIFDTYAPAMLDRYWADDFHSWISNVYGSSRTAMIKKWAVKLHNRNNRTKDDAGDKTLREAVLQHMVNLGEKRVSRWIDSQRPDFRIIVLTMDRLESLRRLLKSLEATDYGGDFIHLIIQIDYAGDSDNSELIHLARNFPFSHGPKTVRVFSYNKGLRQSWVDAWKPKYDTDRFIILEDDVDVASEVWYRWLKSTWQKYGNRTDLAGISLQRQTLIPKKPEKQMEIVNDNQPFLFPLVGSIGFSPHASHWKDFVTWMNNIEWDKVDLSISGLITSDWWNQMDKRHIWTHPFIFFCMDNKLYTLYINLHDQSALAAHHRLKGVHSGGNIGPDFKLASSSSMVNLLNNELPDNDALQKYGWDGEKMEFDVLRECTNTTIIEHAKSIHKKHGVVMLQLLNEGFINMTMSWICNVRRFKDVLDRTLFVTSDEPAYQALTRFDPTLHVVLHPYETPTSMSYGQYKYYDFMHFRTKMILSLLLCDIRLWLVESDAVWLKDPTDIVLNTDGDIVTMNDEGRPGFDPVIQGGFQLLRPTMVTKKAWLMLENSHFEILTLFKEFSGDLKDKGSEQIMMSNILKNSFPNLKLSWLSSDEFVSGWYLTNENPEQGLAKFYNAMVVLNNFIVGNEAKVERAKKWNKWYLNSNRQCIG